MSEMPIGRRLLDFWAGAIGLFGLSTFAHFTATTTPPTSDAVMAATAGFILALLGIGRLLFMWLFD